MRIVAACVVLCVLAASVSGQVYSQLWGERGELYDPHGRLTDFSYAGYWFGDRPIPFIATSADVTEFGANGEDDLDDTDAFRAAIDATDSGAISIPPGRYLISDILWIEKPGIVLRGEDRDTTILHITNTLEDVRPNMGATTSGKATSDYSWSGGFLWVKGGLASTTPIEVLSDAIRGDRQLAVVDASAFKIGDRILIEQRDPPDRSLMRHLYADDPGDVRKLTPNINPRLVAQVIAIHDNQITINRPLRWDVRAAWSPRVRLFSPTVFEVGIESITVEFDSVPYKGHFSELGRNAIAFNATSDCWVRNVRIKNCDSAVFFTGMQGTIDGLVIDSTRTEHRGTQGHHGVTLGLDNVVTNFEFSMHFIHDITMTRLSAGNVIKNGSGINLSLDHHKRANHANLYCNLDAGTGQDLWRCGGGASLGKHAGAWTTFWGIRSTSTISWPRASFGPDLMNLVGLKTSPGAMATSPAGKWLEHIPTEQLEPRDLHQAQLERRQQID
jgi:hypothetical protein